MKDYLIVGAGLAGIAFAETALQNQKSIVVFENDSQHSSTTAAGVFNPVILKRFSSLANAQAQLDAMHDFYASVERRIGAQYATKMPILRRFANVEEQNNWFTAADKDGLKPFLSTTLVHKNFNGVTSPFAFGEVLQTGFVNTGSLLSDYKSFLTQNGAMVQEAFDFSKLTIEDGHVSYKNLKARHIVFAEGFGIKSNPYFNYLPLEGTKGEIITVKAALDLDVIVKAGVFVLPIGNNLFKVGATYNWDDKTETPTVEGMEELIQKLREIVTVDFEVVGHKAGIRPTVKDRKPLVGTHPANPRLHVLNGLGTRGVMLGPTMAQILYDAIENGGSIPPDVNITRFTAP